MLEERLGVELLPSTISTEAQKRVDSIFIEGVRASVKALRNHHDPFPGESSVPVVAVSVARSRSPRRPRG